MQKLCSSWQESMHTRWGEQEKRSSRGADKACTELLRGLGGPHGVLARLVERCDGSGGRLSSGGNE